ncbi:Uncharacterized protein TXXE_07785 [Thermobacillus xylanilyticus]|uniref:Uncharacterized protein n=1 Tax=Thermobacillus xylanilyticus TaxID=76633 RepID=A0ABM8V375_THEXY|nr:Uncharacterized protein TXXE_07785 [Thermobacillus xylanilyticus]
MKKQLALLKDGDWSVNLEDACYEEHPEKCWRKAWTPFDGRKRVITSIWSRPARWVIRENGSFPGCPRW